MKPNFVYILMILLDNSSGFPRFQFDGGGGRKRRNIIGNNEVNYLMKFGYLPQSTLETGALVTRDQLNNAIRYGWRRILLMFKRFLFPSVVPSTLGVLALIPMS